MKIAIQGIKGSFHHIAANEFFGENISLHECMSFDEIPELIKKNIVDGAVMAIENSITGSILPNYLLIDSFNLNVHGEIHLPLINNLMALPGQHLKDIKEVWSDPMAIQNCQPFFNTHPEIRIIEENDITHVAKRIRDKKLLGVATIANKKAAEIYGLEILENEIQADSSDTTRYFILKKNRHHHPEDYLNNKALLKLVTGNEIGSLENILTILSKHNLNIAKIQFIPIVEKSWAYAIFMDLIFDNYIEYCKALLIIEKKVKELKILGEYHENNIFFNQLNSIQILNKTG